MPQAACLSPPMLNDFYNDVHGLDY